MTATAKKITKATLKAFIRKNSDNLHFLQESYFDGMSDGTEYVRDAKIVKVDASKINFDRADLGLPGAWLVSSSGNYFSVYENEKYKGIHVYNCCGSWNVMIPK